MTIKGPATFGKFKRVGAADDPASKSARENPGPGSYKSNFRVLTRNEPKPIFGSASRDQNTFYTTQARYNPGPGTYNYKNIIGHDGKTVTMSPRRPDTSP